MREGRPFGFALVVAALVFTLVAIPNLFENLDATDTMVVQSLGGTLTWYTDQGPKPQMLGRITKYHKRSQYEFGGANALNVQFNDGGHAKIHGSIAWEMPTDPKTLTALHARYGTQESVEAQLIRTVVDKAVYMTGPTMSSTESYASKKTELIRLVSDQVNHGVFQTRAKSVREKDPLSGQDRTVAITEIVEENGRPVRQESSPLEEFGIRAFNLSISKMEYDPKVEAQIQTQQQATMQVQTAIADALKATQAAITAEKQGEAEAAKAKWAQEVIKAKEVTAAEQRLRVSELDAKSAEQAKRREILLGEGESERRKLIMSADGALEKKLDATIKINEIWATAFREFKGRLTPDVVMGGAAGGNAFDATQAAMQSIAIKSVRELAVDTSAKK